MAISDEEKKFRITITPEKYCPIPSDFYTVELAGVSKKSGRFGPVFELHFQVTQGGFVGHQVRGLINVNQTRKQGLLWQLIRALGLVDLDVAESFDLNSLTGGVCKAYIEKKGRNNAIRAYHPHEPA